MKKKTAAEIAVSKRRNQRRSPEGEQYDADGHCNMDTKVRNDEAGRYQGKIDPTTRLDFNTALAKDSRLNAMARCIGIILLSHRNGQTTLICPSHQTLAREAGCSVDTVQRAIKALAKAGWFEVEKQFRDNKQKVNQYHPNWEQAGAASMPSRGRTSADEGPHPCGDRGRTNAVQNSVNINPVNELSEHITQEPNTSSGSNQDEWSIDEQEQNQIILDQQALRQVESTYGWAAAGSPQLSHGADKPVYAHPKTYSDAQWRGAIHELVWGTHRGGRWHDRHGPIPGERGCLMPDHLRSYLEGQAIEKARRDGEARALRDAQENWRRIHQGDCAAIPASPIEVVDFGEDENVPF